jgi:cytoskeletal protein CcmA (bactofilin family)
MLKKRSKFKSRLKKTESERRKKAAKLKTKPLMPSIISAEMHITGDIEGEGALEIAGRVEGNIKCLSVRLLPGSIVYGDISAEEIDIEGEVVGDVKGRFVKCTSTAKIIGNIMHIFVQIENGAYIDGSCRKHLTDDLRMLPHYG